MKILEVLKGKYPLSSKRSKEWPGVRRFYLDNHPMCEVCGGNEKLEVHHIKPFHLFPELELDYDNLITLCESKKYGINCHLFIGHRGNYRNINYDINNSIKCARVVLLGVLNEK